MERSTHAIKFGKASISMRAMVFSMASPVNVITRLGNHNIKDGFRAIDESLIQNIQNHWHGALVSGVSAQPESEFLDRFFWIFRGGTGGSIQNGSAAEGRKIHCAT